MNITRVRIQWTPVRNNCAVEDCFFRYVSGKTSRRFPDPKKCPRAFAVWVQRVNNKRFQGLSPERIAQLFRLCDMHFSKYCRNSFGTKLNKGSLPTLHLPGFKGESNAVNSNIYLLSKTTQLLPENVWDHNSLLDGIDLEKPLAKPPAKTLPEMKKQTNTTVTVPGKVVGRPNDEKPCFNSVKSYVTEGHCITEVCRICLRSIMGDKMVKLYGPNQSDDGKKLKKMIKSVLPRLNLDMYPNSVICDRCSSLLVYSNELKEMAESTESKLIKIINEKKDVTTKDADLIIFPQGTTANDYRENLELVKPVSSHLNEHDYALPPVKEIEINQKVVDKIWQYAKDNAKHTAPIDNSNTQPILDLETKKEPPFTDYRLGPEIPKRSKIDPGPYMCDKCGVIIEERRKFKQHCYRHSRIRKRVIKSIEPRKYVCDQCGATYDTYAAFYKHKQTHLVASFSCDICGKCFKYQKTLDLHVKHAHLKVYDYCQCHLCGKKMAHKNSLRMHLMTHSEYVNRQHVCGVCGMRYITRSKLKKHMMRHEECKYSCDYCGKKIKHLHALNRHIKLFHLNQADIVCQFCSKSYWKKCDLKVHLLRVHGWSAAPKTVE